MPTQEETFEKSTLSTRRFLAAYTSKRLLLYVVTLWLAISLAFIAFHLIPGDPMTVMLGQLSQASGEMIEPEDAQRIIAYYKRLFGLDQPLHIQYLVYFRNLVLRSFDMGPSFIAYPTPTRELILSRMPWTLGVFTTAMLIAWLVGTGLGAILGWLRRHKLSSLATVLATFFQITPVYLVALALIIFIGYELRWLPVTGPYDAHLQPAWSLEYITSVVRHAILPMLSMILVWGAGFTLSMRALMISVLGEDYLIFARAKGLTPSAILKNYAFRNALIPSVTGLGIMLGVTLSGVYIIEVLYVYPGLGSLFVRAMQLRDFNVMQGVVVFSIFAVLTLTLFVDLALPLFDPRIRSSR